jgi:uncharacterized surface protein with fasciclin (FAS1) repeats
MGILQIMKSFRIFSVAALVAAMVTTSLHAGTGYGSSAKAKSVVAVATESGQFTTLVAAIQAAGLVETLEGAGPFTVFAPTDAAFAKLPAGTVESLLKPENRAQLVAILTYHVVPGKVMAADVKTSKAKTVNGQELAIEVKAGKVTVGGATVIATDVAAGNGVIHVIDTVVLPK